MKKDRFFFKAASWVALFIGLSHTIGHFLPVRIENATESKLLTLMTNYAKPVLGGSMSMMDIQNGLSLCYSLFFFTIGCINLKVLSNIKENDPITQASIIYAVVATIGTVVSVLYFFWLPVISFLILAVLFSIAAFQGWNKKV